MHAMNKVSHIPIELMETFDCIVKNEGDATAAAQQLGISQPSISKRLSSLRRIVAEDDNRPWLILKGKRWQLTQAGQRVHAVVSDLIKKYEQVEQFIADSGSFRSSVSIACGQTAAVGFVRSAVEQFAEELPEVQVRVSTTRGKARIVGVAGGQFDLAIVTDNEATIRDVAGMELFVEPIAVDRFVLVANPSEKSAWRKAWKSLPVRRPLTAFDIVDLPLILPERDAERRQQFDHWFADSCDEVPTIAIEVGGWQSILSYSAVGLGVGLVTEEAVRGFQESAAGARHNSLTVRALEESALQPEGVRVIARKPQGQSTPDINEYTQRLLDLLRKSAPQAKGTK
ncbi:MAG TPA: hypothetical protein DDX19_05255 [Rhodopirellula baltica]|nr:hypothetical protein [Rhodopirellula baltica]